MQADIWRAHYSQESGLRFWPCEALVRFLSGQVFDLAVDAGCGNGSNLWLLAEHAKVVYGVDANSKAIAAARAYMAKRGVADRIVFSVDSIFSLPVADGEADLVVDVMVGQHVPWNETPALLTEYRRVLKPGGRLFRYGFAPGTSINSSRLVSPSTYDAVDAFPSVSPVCVPTAPQLSAVLHEAGFDVEGSEYVSREYRDRMLTVYSATEAVAK